MTTIIFGANSVYGPPLYKKLVDRGSTVTSIHQARIAKGETTDARHRFARSLSPAEYADIIERARADGNHYILWCKLSGDPLVLATLDILVRRSGTNVLPYRTLEVGT